MKKNLILLSAALAVSVFSAQAVFAASDAAPTATLTKSTSKLDLSHVTIGEAKAIGSIPSSACVEATLPAGTETSLTKADTQLDFSRLDLSKFKPAGTRISMTKVDTQLDFSNATIIQGEAKAIGPASIEVSNATTLPAGTETSLTKVDTQLDFSKLDFSKLNLSTSKLGEAKCGTSEGLSLTAVPLDQAALEKLLENAVIGEAVPAWLNGKPFVTSNSK